MIDYFKYYKSAAHNFALLIFLFATLLTVFCVPIAGAQEEGWSSPEALFEQGETGIEAVDIDVLKKDLEDAKLFKDLEDAKRVMENESRCGSYIKTAKSSRDELDALNAKNITRTEENYGRQARELKAKNTKAVQETEQCYSAALIGWPAIRSKGIATHSGFTVAYNDLFDFYVDVPNLPSHIKAIEDELARREKGFEPDKLSDVGVAAILDHAHKTVEVLPGGRGKRWKTISKGYKLRLADELRTGPGARARLVFADRYAPDNAGPTVLNVGSDSHISIKYFASTFFKKPETTVIELIRGSLRAFTKGISSAAENQFQVRTGASICGIRGTEVAISYNPDANSVGYHLDHGDAYIENNGEKVQLTPSTARVITNGVMSAELPRTTSDWNQVVQSTGAGHAENQASLAEAYDALFAPKTQKIPPVVPQKSIPHADDNAEFTLREFLNAIKDYDVDTVRRLTTVKVTQKNAAEYKAMLDKKGQRPRDFTIKCTLCDKNLCQILVYIDAEKNLPSQGSDYVFDITRATSSSMWKVHKSSADQSVVDAFRSKSATCQK